MTYCEAQLILDERAAGMDMPEAVVLKALELTGDYEPPGNFVWAAMRESISGSQPSA